MSKPEPYEAELERLQILLVEAQHWTIEQGRKTLIIFEGRDSAGKDGAIKRITEYMSPRQTRVVALPRPTERETSQWYFQRYILVDDGIVLIKLWLDISKAEQARRLAERVKDPLKRFKVSPLDAEAQARWKEYSKARDRMLDDTDHNHAPWTVVATDDKKSARLNIIRHILRSIGGPGAAAEAPDNDLVFRAPEANGRLAP